MYHGIVIDQSLQDSSIIASFSIFAKKKDGNWEIYGIEIADKELDLTISKIQQAMKKHENWYTHLYNDQALIVIFKDKIFHITPHQTSWQQVIIYGKLQKISQEQLDFWPNRFQDERHYFKSS